MLYIIHYIEFQDSTGYQTRPHLNQTNKSILFGLAVVVNTFNPSSTWEVEVDRYFNDFEDNIFIHREL